MYFVELRIRWKAIGFWGEAKSIYRLLGDVVEMKINEDEEQWRKMEKPERSQRMSEG